MAVNGKKWQLIVCSICLLLGFYSHTSTISAEESTLKLVPVSKLSPLKGKDGYLLVKVDVAGVAPSLTVTRLKNSGAFYLDESEKYKPLNQPFTISLKGLTEGFYSLVLRDGLYQVTSVNVPFFNLPFELDTSDQTSWRFSIADGKTNYIGELFIDSERSSKYVNVALFNRVATDKQVIETSFPELLTAAPLRNGSGVRDDFLKLLNQPDAQ